MDNSNLKKAISKAYEEKDKDKIIKLQSLYIDFLEEANEIYFEGYMEKWDLLKQKDKFS